MKTKGKFIVRTTVQHVTKDEATTDYFQRIIGHYHKWLAEAFGQGYRYTSDLDGLEGFKNDYLPNPYNTNKEAYNGSNVMPDVNAYVKNYKYA